MGIILGITYVIPGLCSASMAITLGVYEDLLELFGSFYKPKIIKKHLLFVVGMVIGIVIAISLFSVFYNKFPYLFLALFIGFITSGFTKKYNFKTTKKNQIMLMILIIVCTILLNLVGNFRIISFEDNLSILNYFIIFFIAILSSLALVLPGISGAMVLFIFGIYDLILKSIDKIITNLFTTQPLLDGDFVVLVTFVGGFLLGILAFSKIIDKFSKRYPDLFSVVSNGFVIGSLLILVLNLFSLVKTCNILFVSIVCIIIGFIIGRVIVKK